MRDKGRGSDLAPKPSGLQAIQAYLGFESERLKIDEELLDVEVESSLADERDELSRLSADCRSADERLASLWQRIERLEGRETREEG